MTRLIGICGLGLLLAGSIAMGQMIGTGMGSGPTLLNDIPPSRVVARRFEIIKQGKLVILLDTQLGNSWLLEKSDDKRGPKYHWMLIPQVGLPEEEEMDVEMQLPEDPAKAGAKEDDPFQ